MKIALYHNLPSGGAKRTLGETVTRLVPQHEIDVYTLSSSAHTFADIRGNVSKYEVFQFEPTNLLAPPFGRLNQVIRVFDLIRLRRLNQVIAQTIDRGQYDVAFVEPCRFEGCPSLLRFLSRIPSVYFCHETLRLLYEEMPPRPYLGADLPHRRVLDRLDPLPNLYRGILQRSDRENIHHAQRVLTNSEFSRQAIKAAYGVDPRVCYHGVDSRLFRPLGLDREPWVLSVGSITPLKGFDFIILALAEISPEERPVLKIVSNFANLPEHEYLAHLARSHSVSIEMEVGVSDEELIRFYNRAALTAYAPVNEPFGLVALESMACGTPIVAVGEGGICESVITGRVGLLVERDVGKFARAITHMMDRPGLREEYGTNGRKEVVEKWRWEEAVNRVVAELDGAIRGFSGRLPRDGSIK
jgi:glycosyltransferase involved in cell wall biosynthesis